MGWHDKMGPEKRHNIMPGQDKRGLRIVENWPAFGFHTAEFWHFFPQPQLRKICFIFLWGFSQNLFFLPSWDRKGFFRFCDHFLVLRKCLVFELLALTLAEWATTMCGHRKEIWVGNLFNRKRAILVVGENWKEGERRLSPFPLAFCLFLPVLMAGISWLSQDVFSNCVFFALKWNVKKIFLATRKIAVYSI